MNDQEIDLPGKVTFTFTSSSPQAKKLAESTKPVIKEKTTYIPIEKWPISRLEIGECFIFPRSKVGQISTFRKHMIKRGEKASKGIVVIYHRKHKIIEVARIY